MISETFYFPGYKKTRMYTYTWLPDKKNYKAIVQILHGLAEHAGRYHRFAQVLTDNGYGVYAHDQRAHGNTVKGINDLGYLGKNIKFDCLVRDGYELTNLIKAKHKGVPVFLFGHSLGAYIALGYIEEYGKEINGCMFSGPGYPNTLLLLIGKLILGRELKKHGETYKSIKSNKLLFGAYNKSFTPARTPFDWLNRDNDEVDAYLRDPLCGFICTSGFYYELSEWVKIIFKKENISTIPDTLPLYIIAGEKDPVGRCGKDMLLLFKMYVKAGIKDITKKIYPNARHEVINEINREEVGKDLLTWLETHVK